MVRYIGLQCGDGQMKVQCGDGKGRELTEVVGLSPGVDVVVVSDFIAFVGRLLLSATSHAHNTSHLELHVGSFTQMSDMQGVLA